MPLRPGPSPLPHAAAAPSPPRPGDGPCPHARPGAGPACSPVRGRARGPPSYRGGRVARRPEEAPRVPPSDGGTLSASRAGSPLASRPGLPRGNHRPISPVALRDSLHGGPPAPASVPGCPVPRLSGGGAVVGRACGGRVPKPCPTEANFVARLFPFASASRVSPHTGCGLRMSLGECNPPKENYPLYWCSLTLFCTSGPGDSPGVGVDRESSQRGTHRPVIRITQPDGSVSPTIQAEAISRDTQGRHADHPPWWEWTPPFRTQGIERITQPRHADHPA